MPDTPIREKLETYEGDNGILYVDYVETEVNSDRHRIAGYNSRLKSLGVYAEYSRETINAVLDLIHEYDNKALY